MKTTMTAAEQLAMRKHEDFHKMLAVIEGERARVINGWSILPTADSCGLSIKEKTEHDHIEVCVAMRHGYLEVNVYIDGEYSPFQRLSTRLPQPGDNT